MRRWRLERALNAAIVVAALATIPLILAEEQDPTNVVARLLDWTIWAIFVSEYAIRVTMAPDRLSYTWRHWLNVAIIVVSFPLLPNLLELARLARLGRLLRLLRLVLVSYRGFQALDPILGRQGLRYLFAAIGLLVLSAGGILATVEPDVVDRDYWSGVWWAIVTVTTVGYGDITPKTLPGRLLATAIMIAGLGLVSALAGSIAAYFVRQGERTELQNLAERMDRIEMLVQRLVE